MPQSRTNVTRVNEALAAEFQRIRTDAGVRSQFPAAVLAEAEAADWRTGHLADAERQDARDIEFITIDPPGAQDLDQALHIERLGEGHRVRYAIADVAAFVTPGGAIDTEANARGETIYCPDQRVPLHPPILSEDRASLLPEQDRPAIVWTMELDASGQVQASDVRRALVRSRRQLTYEQAQARREDDEVIGLLFEVGTRRSELERARGGVSLERPEQLVEADNGTYRLTYRAELEVEEHNAQISLMTGMVAADLMARAGVGILRTMPPADPHDLERLRNRAMGLGISWPKAASYAEVLDSLDLSDPRAVAFTVAATRLFRGASWQVFHGEVPADWIHGALAARYAHVTAPLRRMVDRYGQEIALAACAGTDVPTWVLAALEGAGERMGEAARVGAQVDRACTDAVEAAVLAHRVGELFDAVGLDERSIQLADLAVEAPCSGKVKVGHHLQARLTKAEVDGGTVKFKAQR